MPIDAYLSLAQICVSVQINVHGIGFCVGTQTYIPEFFGEGVYC
jgi:hypothetical protein